jgi:hypothetical protein
MIVIDKLVVDRIDPLAPGASFHQVGLLDSAFVPRHWEIQLTGPEAAEIEVGDKLIVEIQKVTANAVRSGA